jgi:hypothetical protein
MQRPKGSFRAPDDDAFRAALRAIVARTGRSARAVSLAMGRDPGYVTALLDPSRPSRARPTPADLARLSDATDIPLLELFESVWGIPPDRFAAELQTPGVGKRRAAEIVALTAEDRDLVAAFARLLAGRRRRTVHESTESE